MSPTGKAVGSKHQFLLCMGVGADCMGNSHICEGTINAERHVQIWSKMYLLDTVLSRDIPAFAISTTPNQHSAHITGAGLLKQKGMILDWPVCDPDRSPTETELKPRGKST